MERWWLSAIIMCGHKQKSDDNFQKIIFTFHLYICSKNRTWVIGLAHWAPFHTELSCRPATVPETLWWGKKVWWYCSPLSPVEWHHTYIHARMHAYIVFQPYVWLSSPSIYSLGSLEGLARELGSLFWNEPLSKAVLLVCHQCFEFALGTHRRMKNLEVCAAMLTRLIHNAL